MAVVLLVRHGQASFGADDYDVLSETGWAQARLLGDHLARHGVEPTAVVRGGMRRHRETVSGLLEAMAAKGAAAPAEDDVVVDPRWDEFDHLGVVAAHPDLPQGGTAGLERREFQRVFVESTRRWATAEPAADGTVPDYPESFAAFTARSRAALDDACERAAAQPSGLVLAVTSGGPVGALCAHLVDPDGDDDPVGFARRWERFNTVCVNSSVSRVVIGRGGVRLLGFNDHTHLDRDHVTYR